MASGSPYRNSILPGWRAVCLHQQPSSDAHLAVIRLHQPALGVLLEMGRHAATSVEEVLGADACRDQTAAGGEGPQILVEAVFIRLLVFEARGLRLSEDRTQVIGEGLAVVLIAQPEVPDFMPMLRQQFGHATHPREDRDDLLGVMHDVIRLGTDLHEDVSHGCVLLGEPRMLRVQLVAEDETDGRGHARKGRIRSRLASVPSNPFAKSALAAFVRPMGKIARILAVTIGLIASLFGPACDPWVTEHGDKQAKGERAMALLGSLFLGTLVIIGTCAYHQWVNPLGSGLFVTMIMLSVPVSIVPYILWDRGISRRERERAEATPQPTPES